MWGKWEIQEIVVEHIYTLNALLRKIGVVQVLLTLGTDLGIPNVRGTIVNYDGSVEPEPPEPRSTDLSHPIRQTLPTRTI